MLLSCLYFMLFSGPAVACRIYATIGSDLPNGMLYDNLVSDLHSLLNLSYTNNSGWGIGYYSHFGETPSFYRGAPPAWNDPNFTPAVTANNTPPEPQIVMAHIRLATSGCMGVADPHPFYQDRVGKRWLFEHNGGDDIAYLRDALIGAAYLATYPPLGSGIPQCASNPVGSEYYFLYYLKTIEQYGWNVVNGLTAAIKTYAAHDTTRSMNFVMSDGKTLWAFRRGVDASHGLMYLDKSLAEGYAAVASQNPSDSQGDWQDMTEYQLIVFRPGAAPVIINDVRTYCPGDINGDMQVNNTDLQTLAGNFGHGGSGDLDFDGDVDGADLAALIAAYGKACP
jgi:predicted glutamine amidotransferase